MPCAMEDFLFRFRSKSVSTQKKRCSQSPIKEQKRVTWKDGSGNQFRPRCSSTPTTDLTVRRDAFSRRQYGSVETLTLMDDDCKSHSAGRFRIESGDLEGSDEVSSPVASPVHLENPEFQTRWYFKYFLGKLHQNYVGIDTEKDPFILSVVVTDANNHNVPQYRAVLWRKNGAKRVCLPYNPQKPQTVKGILSHFELEKFEKGPKEIFDPDIQKDILVLEEQEGSINFKFGVVYAKENQVSDEEFYSNDDPSQSFNSFSDLLGDRIKLKGWEKFKGGLDVKSNATGTESIYTVYEGHEIMFHVSTLLPHSLENKQQVERKRHIGNDIVNILFYESSSPDPQAFPQFKPCMMRSRFTHIFAVVCYNTCDRSYRLNVFSEESVPLFGPPLPSPPVFHDADEFREFLLVKLINGEKAAVNNPLFAQKRERTLEMLIKNIHQGYMMETNKLYRRAFSDVIQDAHISRKEEARRSEYVRVGQTLKVKTILKGDAPTSLVTTGLLKREPWEPQSFCMDFPHPIICGDSWGDNKLILSTDNGTFIVEEGLNHRSIFDKSVPVKQLDVVEAHNLLIFRCDKGKEGKIYVYRLNDFEGEVLDKVTRGKAECRENRIEKTKGCHLYALSRQGASHLRMVVAIQKRLLLFTWKHSVAWSTWCPTVDFEIVDGFNFVRELQAFDSPQLITLIDGVRDDNQICVGYKNQFDLINEKNGDTLQLYQVEANKVNLVAALDIYEDEESELLLCFNHVSHFQKLSEETSNDFDFNWNSEPSDIVCAFPYVMAFTADSIEIRLIINGNLVHAMSQPGLSLITSKCDIYFCTLAGPGGSPKEKSTEQRYTPPSSPSAKTLRPPQYIYKIPLSCLAGQMTTTDKSPMNPTPPHQSTLLAPVAQNGDRSPSNKRRSPLLRTKCIHPSGEKTASDRHDSSGSDSGISILRPGNNSSPPDSPYQQTICTLDFSHQETDLV